MPMSDTPRTDELAKTVQGQNWGYRDMFLLCGKIERELSECRTALHSVRSENQVLKNQSHLHREVNLLREELCDLKKQLSDNLKSFQVEHAAYVELCQAVFGRDVFPDDLDRSAMRAAEQRELADMFRDGNTQDHVRKALRMTDADSR
jgi:L-lysine 2,3-aminomutase